MNTFRHRSLAALSILLSGIVPILADQVTKDGEPQPAISDVRLKSSGSSGETKGARTESREVMITADKPGIVHLWHYYGDTPLAAPLLPSPDGTSYFRKVAYEALESGGQSGAAVFTYRIIAGPGEKEVTKTVELWNHRHIGYDDFAKGLRGIQDPSGTCLRGVPLDLTPVGDEALLMEVTETPAVSQVSPWIMHIWHPTYPSKPELPSGLMTMPVQIGYLITTSGDSKNGGNPPDGQKVGRISQRDGKFVAHLSFQYGSSTTGFDGALIPERAVDFDMRAFSGAVWPVVGVLTTNRDMMPFLLKQLRKDMKGRKWEGTLNE
jgi:hypothetical protein